MDEHNAEEEMEIAKNIPLIQNTYMIFNKAINNHWEENSKQNTICHRKKLPVTERNLLSREDTSCDGKN